MDQFPHAQPINTQDVETLVKQLFPARDTQVARVLSGVSTYVYRIISQSQTYYLRIQPEEGMSFAPEIAALTQLRQRQLRVPEVIYAEDSNALLKRPLMIETEIKGLALSKSALSVQAFEDVAIEAGRDLARINQLRVEGFGWTKVRPACPTRLFGTWPTFRAFVLEHRQADLAYLRTHVLKAQATIDLERILDRYDAWLDSEEQAYLGHGDFDTTHIFQENGHYTGIIDFGEVRGTNPVVYDLAHFRIRDRALPPYRLFPALERGYQDITSFAPDYEQRLRFTSILINVRALARGFQTRVPDEYLWRQIDTLHEDLAALS